MNDQFYSVNDLVDAFIFMRQQGASPDYALQELRKLRPVITPQEREGLVSEIRLWETTEGDNYPPRSGGKIVPWSPGATLDHNPLTEENVAFQLSQGTRQLVLDPHMHDKPAHEGDIKSATFIVKGHEDRPITISFTQNPEIILGRTNTESILLPDVDLATYEAEDYGVSRVHATLKKHEGVVTISDMGSSNHTYLNNTEIHPLEIRVLPDNSEIRLGKLPIRVVFHRG